MIPIITPVSSTHTLWFEYLLQPEKFHEHLELLKQKKVYPLSEDLIKMFLSQAISKTVEGVITFNKNERAKKLCSMCGEVILSLELSLDYIEEKFPPEYQSISIYNIPTNDKKSFQSQFLLQRWILRSFAKGSDPKIIQTLIANIEEYANTATSLYQNSVDYLKNWIADHDENTSDEEERVLLYCVNFEIAEYLFINENFEDAHKYFSKAKSLKENKMNICDELDNHRQKKNKSEEDVLESYILTCQSILMSIPDDQANFYSKIPQKVEFYRIKFDDKQVLELLIEDTLSDDPSSPIYRNSLESQFENRSIFDDIVISNTLHTWIHFDRIVNWKKVYRILSNKVENLQFLFQISQKLFGSFSRAVIEYLQNLVNTLEIYDPSYCTHFYSENAKRFWEMLFDFGTRNSINEFQNRKKEILKTDDSLKDSIHQQLKKQSDTSLQLFDLLAKSENINAINLKNRGIYYSLQKQWKTSQLLFENAKDYYNNYYIAIKTNRENFDFNQATKMAMTIGIPDLPIIEFFISTMLNKNHFQDIYNYCDLIDSKRRDRLNQVNPDLSLTLIGHLCEIGQSLSGLCEALKSDEPDFQRVGTNALVFLNRFRKQEGSLKFNWDQSSGILSHLTNTTILDSICLTFAALIRLHTIQSIELQSTPITNQMIDPNYLLLSLSHYGNNHLLKLQTIFQSSWNSLDSRTSSQFSNESLAFVGKCYLETTLKLCVLQPMNPLSSLQHADAYFEDGDYYKAFCEYLYAGCVETSFFSSNSLFIYDVNTLYRMVKCLVHLQAYCQAAVLSQLIPSKYANDYSYIYYILQLSPQSLNTTYFQYIWETSFLELLISVYSKRKDDKKLNFLIEIISKSEINQNNSSHIRLSVQTNLEISFFKELSREFLVN